MKQVFFGTLKKKNYKGLKAFIRKLFRKTNWVVDTSLYELPIIWDKRNKIDDSFDGKEVGFEWIEIKGVLLNKGVKFKANIVTFYPDIYRKIYPNC